MTNMTEIPAISVIIPVYNAASFVDRCLDSLVAQSLQDFELIVVDDGSSDGGLEVIRHRLADFAAVQLLAGERGGPAAARNRGLRLARGEFLFFLDADDSLEPKALEQLLSVARAEDADFVIGNYRKIQTGMLDYGRPIAGIAGGRIERQAILQIALAYLRAPNATPIFNNVWGRLYRREISIKYCIDFDEKLFVGEDIDFNYKFLNHTNNVFFIENIIYNYSVSSSLSSASMDRRISSILASSAVDRVVTFLLANGVNQDQVTDAAAQARTTLAIIGIVRLATAASAIGIAGVVRIISDLLADQALQDSVPLYRPGTKGSRWMPRLIALRWPLAAFLLGWVKAVRRYGLRTCLVKSERTVTKF